MTSKVKSQLQEELIRRLLSDQKKIPRTAFGRLGRTAMAAFYGRHLFSGGRAKTDDPDIDALDVDAVVRFISTLGQLKGIAMKGAQIMSYIDMALPDSLRSALSVLQTHSQPMPFEWVRDIIFSELPQVGERLVNEMQQAPIAAASIGQVHRSRLGDDISVAVKVQYPEIQLAIENDFSAANIGPIVASIVYPGTRIDGYIREARDRLLEECDYLHEASAQQRFAELFDNHPWILVPRVYSEYCSRRVLTTAYVDGVGLDAFLNTNPPGEVRNRLGQALFEFYIGSIFKFRLYNCDPHPGNYLFLRDGRIAILDYGCTREFDPAFVANLKKLTLAVHRDEQQTLHDTLVEIGIVREGASYDFDLARALLRAFFGPMLRDEDAVIDLGDAISMKRFIQGKRQLMKLTLPGEFLFLFRIRFGLMSILAKLGSRANWYKLERQCLQA